MPHRNADSERTLSMGNDIIGKVLSVILSQWLNFPMDPGCNSFIQYCHRRTGRGGGGAGGGGSLST